MLLESNPMVRSLVISILLPTLILAGCWKEPGKFNWKNAPGAEEYERLMWEAIRQKEWNDMENHLAPAFVGVNANGQKFDRVGWVEYWKGTQVTDFSLGEFTTQPDGPDMVVTYELNLKGASSAPMSAVRVISVWQQVKNGWVLTAQSATTIK